MLFFSVQRYLVVGGSEKMAEVVEFITSNSTPSYGKLPTNRGGAVGAILGHAPIVCGGNNGSRDSIFDSCLIFENSQWNQRYSMNKTRGYPAGVQINSTTFWILGGYSSGSPRVHRNSTEFIIEGQNNGVPGPKLPYGLEDMCAVKLSEEEIFVIGGMNGSHVMNEVWIYDQQNGYARSQGSSLNTKRQSHSCSTMKNGGETVIVVAGGWNGEQHIDSVEIYDPTDNTWHSGERNNKKKL